MLKRLLIIVLGVFLFIGTASAAETQEVNTVLPITTEIELYDVKAIMSKGSYSTPTPGVSFKLKNNGKDTIEDVEVVIFFKDKDGKIIHEESYNPLRKIFTTPQKLLKPGYIWQIEREKFYLAPSVPTEWKEGAVEGKIINIVKKK